MRVDRDLDNQRGAAMVSTALIVGALCMISALSIDLGQVWTERRGLITASDSAALAAANSMAAGGLNGCNTAQSYVIQNAPQATMSECDVTIDGLWAGTVEVEVTNTVDYGFARVAGFNSQEVSSTTVASWGVNLATGLRPFGLCETSNPEFEAWLANPTTVEEITFSFGTASSSAVCSANGASPGNWGIVDFDGGSNSTTDIRNQTRDGYPGSIFTTSTPGTCAINPIACYEGNPGSLSGSLKSALQDLEDSNDVFPLPIFRSAEGNGANLQFKMTKVANARLVDFKTNGQLAKRYLTFEMQPNLVQDGEPETVVQVCSFGQAGSTSC